MKCRTSDKIMLLEEMMSYVKMMRLATQGSFVFTTGAFDLLHDGHVRYLEDAAMLGDVLLVAVDSDERVRSQKGDSRPAYNESVRLHVVAALEFVDKTFLYTDLEQAVKLIEPDIIVASPTTSFDPNMQRYAFARKMGIEIHPVASRSDTHTSLVIERIKTFG